MQHVVVMTLNMLVKMNRSMNRTSALALCKMMELMKVHTYVHSTACLPHLHALESLYNVRMYVYPGSQAHILHLIRTYVRTCYK